MVLETITGLATSFFSNASGFVVQYLPHISGMYILAIGVGLLLFLFGMRKLFGLFRNLAIIAIGAAVIPLAAGNLGYGISLTLSTFITFFTIGVGAYFILMFLKVAYFFGRRANR